MNVISDALAASARRTAVGMAAHVADGREAEANLLISLYMREAMADGVIPPEALMIMVKTLTSMAVAIAGDDAAERFRVLASNMSAVDS